MRAAYRPSTPPPPEPIAPACRHSAPPHDVAWSTISSRGSYHHVTDQGRQAIQLQAHQGLGRHPNNAIQLLDTIVSKEHCIVEQQGTSMILRDLGSMNGTFVNGERVAGTRLLRHGDEIRMGNTVLQFDDGITPSVFALPAASPGVVHHAAAVAVNPATGAPAAQGSPQWIVKSAGDR
jgi:adenylate cyclase